MRKFAGGAATLTWPSASLSRGERVGLRVRRVPAGFAVAGSKGSCIMSDHRPSAELLESAHEFPGVYQIKAIGTVANDFERRVVEAVAAELASASDLDYSTRTTRRGGHISLTLNVQVQNSEQVRAIYARLHAVEGMTMLL
jgi:uncharacterized protein